MDGLPGKELDVLQEEVTMDNLSSFMLTQEQIKAIIALSAENRSLRLESIIYVSVLCIH